MAARVVVDTNLLVGSAYAPESASRRIVTACLRGELVVLMSHALRQEYEFILPRAVRVGDFQEALRQLLERAEIVEPSSVPRVVPDDPDDDKLVALAVAGSADAILTNDRHLLGLDPYQGIRILRPGEFASTHITRS